VIIHNVIQGSTEWLAIRAGIPTASCFDKIITPKGKASTQAEKYLHKLLAEKLMGHPCIEFKGPWMERGNDLESDARAYYESMLELETEKVGFITNDARTIGASPDSLVGDDGLLEFKCPAEHTHVAYMLTRAVDAEYYPQVQGQLWVTGRTWLDIMSFHPEMPPVIIRVERDEKYIAIMAAAVTTFSEHLEMMAADLRRAS
jgi:YqaJ-like recombinase protein